MASSSVLKEATFFSKCWHPISVCQEPSPRVEGAESRWRLGRNGHPYRALSCLLPFPLSSGAIQLQGYFEG